MPFGRRYELERPKRNRRRENTSPRRNSARLWTAAVLCRFSFADGMRVKIVHTSLPEKRQETGAVPCAPRIERVRGETTESYPFRHAIWPPL
jgi:hypothetical protein